MQTMRPYQRPKFNSLVELARYRAIRQPHRTAFILLRNGEDEAARLTFAELDARARNNAARLQQAFAPGDRVLLSYAPGLEFITALFGCLYAGVVAVPVYPPSGTLELGRLKKLAMDTDAAGLCMGTAGFNQACLGRALPSLRWGLRCMTMNGDRAAGAADWVESAIAPDALALLQFTHGSTGTPKIVMLSHRNVLHNQDLLRTALKTSSRTVGVSWLAPYEGMGLLGHLVQPLYLGAVSVLMSPAAFITKPARWLQAISRYRASVSGGPNSAYELCVRRITADQVVGLNLDSWAAAFNGAEMVRPKTLSRFADRFASSGFRRESFVACYGLSEATLLVSAGRRQEAPVLNSFDGALLQQHVVQPAPADAAGAQTFVGCGRAPDKSVVIVDPERRVRCACGRVGEIWVRGEGVAMGYWRAPQATQAVFQAHLADTGEGPFLRTGDLGFVSDGELHVTGCLGDLISIRNRKHYPHCIEEAVRASHPALTGRAGAAFAIGSNRMGRLIVLHEVHRHALHRVRHAQVAEAAQRALHTEFGIRLHELVFLPEGSLPRTESGRVRRNASRDAYVRNNLPAAVRLRRHAASLRDSTRQAFS